MKRHCGRRLGHRAVRTSVRVRADDESDRHKATGSPASLCYTFSQCGRPELHLPNEQLMTAVLQQAEIRRTEKRSGGHQEVRQPPSLQYRDEHLRDARRSRRDGSRPTAISWSYDAKTGDDLTHSVLTQIIVEQESRSGGQTLLPMPVPAPADPLLRRQHRQAWCRATCRCSLRDAGQRAGAFPRRSSHRLRATRRRAFDAYQEQARKNMAMFEQAMKMWTPFSAAVPLGGGPQRRSRRGPASTAGARVGAGGAAAAAAMRRRRTRRSGGAQGPARRDAGEDREAVAARTTRAASSRPSRQAALRSRVS